MIKTCLLFCVCAYLTLICASIEKDVPGWSDWKAKYNKVYSGEEEGVRRAIWEKNRMIVEEHNAKSDSTFKLELNEFADKDFSDVKTQGLPDKFHAPPSYNPKGIYKGSCPSAVPQPLPASFDWRTHGVVPPVGNQGQMGSSAILTVEKSIESLNSIKTGQLKTGSAQEIHDCCFKPIVTTPETLLDCVINKLHGLCSEADYPLSHNKSCMAGRCRPSLKVQDFNTVSHGDEKLLQQELLQTPVVVTIDASHRSFQLYRSGVYQEKNCGQQLDHTMLLVGYGVMEMGGASVEYWLCQNTWGAAWGDRGYIKIARDHDNMCGIASAAYRPC